MSACSRDGLRTPAVVAAFEIAEAGTGQEGLDGGADGYLTHPVGFARLIGRPLSELLPQVVDALVNSPVVPPQIQIAGRHYRVSVDPGAPDAGTGLGLSMLYGVVKQSGGYLRTFSTLGEGTRIEIYLPSVGAAPAGVIRPAPAERPAATGRGGRPATTRPVRSAGAAATPRAAP